MSAIETEGKSPAMSDRQQRIRRSAQIGPEQAGLRVDQAAAELLDGLSRARLQKWLRSGELTLDGQAVKPTYRVSAGETLQLDAEPERDERVVAQDINLDLVHADADILVLNKPAGLVVHPAAGNPDGTLQNALLHFDPDLAALPRAGIVHRLDKDTSGIMVVARSLRAHQSLVGQLQDRSMSRQYRAVALGEAPASGTVDAPIGRHPVDRKRMAVVPRGRPAVTHYRLLEKLDGVSHLEVSLETGRTHQIRVHLAHVGLPLVGDPVYGRSSRRRRGMSDELAEVLRSFPRQALHAERLRLVHPGSGEALLFSVPLAEDIENLLRQLRELAA